MREQKHGDAALACTAEQAGDDHHLVARQAVGPDAADQEKEDVGEGPRREHQPQVGLRTRQLEDGERKRDRRHAAAEERDDAPEEQQAELPLTQRRERVQPRGGQCVEPSQPYQPSSSMYADTRFALRFLNSSRV